MQNQHDAGPIFALQLWVQTFPRMMKNRLPKIMAMLLSILLSMGFAPAALADVVNMNIPYQQNDPQKYQIEIDLTNQVGTIYERDQTGEYTVIARQFLVTSGDKENPTPTGTFRLGTMRERFGYFLNFKVYAQYWTQVVRGIYLHSVLYSKRNEKALNRSSYNNLGKNVSHGCVRMLVEDARFIYYNCPPGTVCRLVKKAKNASLTASLKSKVAWNKYKPEPDPIPEVLPVQAVILNDNVPLRTGFSIGAHEIDKTLATLSAGTKIEVLQAGSDWVKARVGKKEGYIQTKHVRAVTPEMKDVKQQVVSVEQAYVYAEMSTKSDIYATLSSGTQVTVLDDSQRLWLKVRVNSIDGYMLKSHVSTVVVSVPVGATPDPAIAVTPSDAPIEPTPAPTPVPTPEPTPVPTPVPTPTPFLQPLF